jgi:hypothetical protein
MAVRSSALRAGRSYPPRIFSVLISVRGCVDLRAIVRLGGIVTLKRSADLIIVRQIFTNISEKRVTSIYLETERSTFLRKVNKLLHYTATSQA